MPADQIARTTVAARLGNQDRLADGLGAYAALEYRREDLLWLQAQVSLAAAASAPRSGRLSRSWVSRLLARNPAPDPEVKREAPVP